VAGYLPRKKSNMTKLSLSRHVGVGELTLYSNR